MPTKLLLTQDRRNRTIRTRPGPAPPLPWVRELYGAQNRIHKSIKLKLS